MNENSIFIDIKNDIITLQRLLEKHFVENLPNLSELGKVVTQLGKDRNRVLCFEDVKLEFTNLDLGKDIRPVLNQNQCKKAILELRFTILKWLSVISQPLNDPIQEYQLQLILKISDFETLLAKSAWHFEKHPDRKTDNTPEATPEFHHPLYHLHFGGYEITDEEEDFQFGNILIIEAPRIMHPPMDIVLAIDFVLKNFYSCHNCKPLINLTSQPDYIRIVRNARERFWKPFAFGFASNFTTNHHFETINYISVTPTYARNLITYSEKH